MNMPAVIESTAVTVTPRLTAVEIRAQVNLVQEVMRGVMQEDVHYGKIPGTPKPTLYKAGGEKLAQTFRLAPTYIVDDLSDADVARFRVTCRLTHQTSGMVIGDGIGSCSSSEEKYKWRRPVCNEEFFDTSEDRRREKWVRGQQGPYKAKQIRTEKADIENTILKMAAKRAFLAAILNATAASDIFTQDIEDLPEELRHDDEGAPQTQAVEQPRSTRQPPAQPPASAPATGSIQQPAGAAPAATSKPISEGAKATLLRRIKGHPTVTEESICSKFGVEKIDALTFEQFQAAMKHLNEAPAEA